MPIGVGLGLTLEILLANVVFRSKSDDEAIPMAASYLCVFAALFLAGRVPPVWPPVEGQGSRDLQLPVQMR